MNKGQKAIYCFLNALFLVTCFFSFTIYTSLMSEQLPWHDPCGMQFLAILLISCPLMLCVGVAYTILGKFTTISNVTKALPFITMVVMGAIVILDGTLGQVMQVAGTASCVIALMASILLGVKDLKKLEAPRP